MKMRKVISYLQVSLDGFVTGSHQQMNWIIMDEEIFKDGVDLTATTDTALYGRITYQMMAAYWPTVLCNPLSTQPELRYAQWLENIEKIVFSRTLEKAEWNNSRLVKKNITEEVMKLKQHRGKSMLILGSPGLTQSFMKRDLIDEFRVNVNPVILGNGMPLFGYILHPIHLELLSEKKFSAGVVGLHYKTKKQVYLRG